MIGGLAGQVLRRMYGTVPPGNSPVAAVTVVPKSVRKAAPSGPSRRFGGFTSK